MSEKRSKDLMGNQMTVSCTLFEPTKSKEVVGLYVDVFAAAEGESEGKVIGQFVTQLMETTPLDDVIGCVAMENDKIIGCLFFSHVIMPNGQKTFILSPMAVSTERQGEGVGQQLIRFGLAHLNGIQVELVLTYGDPAYYSKTGFITLSEKTIQAPFPLSQPIGWLVQSLDGKPIQTQQGAVQCVAALQDPNLW